MAVGTPKRPVGVDAIAATDLAHAATAVSEPGSAPAAVPRRRRRWGVIAALAVVVAGGATTAIVVATHDDTAAPAGPKVKFYPDTADGFDQFAHDLVATVQNSREDEFAAIAATVALPHPEAWFRTAFGDDAAPRLVTEYEQGPGPDFGKAWDELRTVVVHESRSLVTTSRHLDPDDELATGYQVTALRKMRAPIALYRLRMSRADGTGIYALWSWVHVGGRFRLVGKMKQVDPPDPNAEMATEMDMLSELPMVEARRFLREKSQ